MKNLKFLLFLIMLISQLAQCQTPLLKTRSNDSFIQVDNFLNVKKRFGIPFSSTNNLSCNDSYSLMFNTTENKLKLYNGISWINPFSLNFQEVLNSGNFSINTGISFFEGVVSSSNSFSISKDGFNLSRTNGTANIDNAGLSAFNGFFAHKAPYRTSLDAYGIKITSNFPFYDNRLLAGTVTSNRTWTLPNVSGTILCNTATLANTINLSDNSGNQRLIIDSTGLVKLVSGAPVYSDNASAISAGLSVGTIYRTSIGQLMIVY